MDRFAELEGFNATKIIGTLGPATESPEAVQALLEAGLDLARLNMSHGTHESHGRLIATVRAVSAKMGRQVGIILDLQGPRMRVGEMPEDGVELRDGAECVITAEPVTGTAERFATTYEALGQDVAPGDRVMLDDGLLELRVKAVQDGDVRCEVVHGGTLRSHKGMNLPGVSVSAAAMSEKDEEDLAFGLAQGVDYVALSFVRRPEDVIGLRSRIRSMGHDTPVISKLERPEAIDHLEAIVRESDAIMVARGDLAVETSPEEVPLLQKRIIGACGHAHRPVIIATQMLESMTESPRPTRAEASDVANAILDGADAVMLSGETAVGKYPTESVAMMRRIAAAAEKSTFEGEHLITQWHGGRALSFGEAVSRAAAEAAEETGAQALIAFTQSGRTARIASKCRPRVPIIAATPLVETARRCTLYWGVAPMLVGPAKSTDEQIELVDVRLRELAIVEPGETVVITAGTPIAVGGTTNTMKLHVVGGGQ
jgi:pyruvate kinase